MHRWWHARTALWISILFVCVATTDGQDAAKKKESVMRKKLTAAQKILEGVAVNNFAMIETSAKALIKASQDAAWQVLKTPRYELYSDEFRRGAREVIKAAQAKKTEAAALGYVQITLTCVKCHEYVREEGRANLPVLPAGALDHDGF